MGEAKKGRRKERKFKPIPLLITKRPSKHSKRKEKQAKQNKTKKIERKSTNTEPQ